MKRLSKLKLNEISKRNLSQKEMRHVKGGDLVSFCTCACAYETQGGSGTYDNCIANRDLKVGGAHSEYGGENGLAACIKLYH